LKFGRFFETFLTPNCANFLPDYLVVSLDFSGLFLEKGIVFFTKKIFDFIILLSLAGILLFTGCTEKKPLCVEGNGEVQVYVDFKESPELPGIPVENAKVELRPQHSATIPPCFTDDQGIARFQNLISGTYIASATYRWDSLKVLVGSTKSKVLSNSTVIDTVHLFPSKPGLKINELYTVGPPNDEFYFYDQFIELYNSADDTVYLDGMIVCRLSRDITKVTYIFQFPGTPVVGREHPVPPHTFVVLAQDAIDHSKIIPGSIDLSHADWEFYNPNSPSDPDNPDVPNIVNIKVGERIDFLISLTSDEIIIATGEDINYQDGIDFDTVIDGVEYQSSSTSLKTLDPRIDRGFTGVGLVKYSGMSLERKYAGLDTDDSRVDFHIIPHPTPGYEYRP